MASFSFLAPVFGVIFGWLILDENISLTIFGSLLLVSIGIILINWKTKSR
jgi:drug/metabolite transporter (DMT)-like permease